jgi:hypothetical protein
MKGCYVSIRPSPRCFVVPFPGISIQCPANNVSISPVGGKPCSITVTNVKGKKALLVLAQALGAGNDYRGRPKTPLGDSSLGATLLIDRGPYRFGWTEPGTRCHLGSWSRLGNTLGLALLPAGFCHGAFRVRLRTA